jgi:hypothetical protein
MTIKEQKRIYDKKRYEILKEQGICTKCGKNPVHTYGAVRCARCARLQKFYSNRHYENNTQVYKERDKVKHKRNRDNGCCTHCGNPNTDGFIKCVNCRLHFHKPSGVENYANAYKTTSKRS